MNRSFPQSFWSSLCTSNPDHQVISFMTVWLVVDKCHKITECCIGIVCLHSYICVFVLNSGICVAFSMAGIFQWKVPVNWIRLSVLLLSLCLCVLLYCLSYQWISLEKMNVQRMHIVNGIVLEFWQEWQAVPYWLTCFISILLYAITIIQK